MRSAFVKYAVLLALVFAALALPASASGPAFYSDFGSWSAAVPTWAGVDLSSYSEFDTIQGGDPIALPYNETLTFDKDLQVYHVGSGWSTWYGDSDSNGFDDAYGLPVLYTLGETSVTGTFGPGADIPYGFGLEMEPNPFTDIALTLTLSDGDSLSQTVNGYGDATFFGWVGGGVTGMTLSGQSDFAFGNMVKAAPEPTSLALLGTLGVPFAIAKLRRRR